VPAAGSFEAKVAETKFDCATLWCFSGSNQQWKQWIKIVERIDRDTSKVAKNSDLSDQDLAKEKRSHASRQKERAAGFEQVVGWISSW